MFRRIVISMRRLIAKASSTEGGADEEASSPVQRIKRELEAMLAASEAEAKPPSFPLATALGNHLN